MILNIREAECFIKDALVRGRQVAAFETIQEDDVYKLDVLYADTVKTINWIIDGGAPGGQKTVGVFSPGYTGNLRDDLCLFEPQKPEKSAMRFISNNFRLEA